MGRTAMARGSAAAQNIAAYSQSELGFATHFNMYPEVQLPSPNGSLGHTRGLVNCAVARSKALINAVMPVYFVWNKKSHISNGTAKSVGSIPLSALGHDAELLCELHGVAPKPFYVIVGKLIFVRSSCPSSAGEGRAGVRSTATRARRSS